MLYLLAAIGAVTIAILAWRAFGHDLIGVSVRKSKSVAPDDDPEFLRELEERTRRKGGGVEGQDGTTPR